MPTKPASIKTLTRHSIIYGFGHILTRLVSFLLLPLHTNYLNPETYGVASLLAAVIAIMTIIYGVGIDAAFLRYYVLANDDAERRRIFSTAIITLTISAALLTFGGVALASPFSTGLFDTPAHADLVRLTSGVLFFDAIAFIPFLLLRAEERSRHFILIKFGNVTVNFALNLWFIVGLGRGIAGIFEANLISSALTLLLLLPVGFRHLRLRFSPDTLNTLLRFGLPFLPASLAVIAIDILDRFLLKLLAGLEVVGIYSTGYRLGMIMALAVTAFRFAWVPFFLKSSEQEGATRTFSRVLTYFHLVAAFLFLATCLFIDEIVRLRVGSFTLFGEDYWQATVIVPVVLLAYWVYGFHLNFLVGIHLKEKTAVMPIITGVGVAVNVAGNFLLIPAFGMMGAAWATVLAHLFMAGAVYFVSQKLYRVTYEPRRLFLITAVTLLLFVVNRALDPEILTRLVLLGTMPILLRLLGFFEKSELELFKRISFERLLARN